MAKKDHLTEELNRHFGFGTFKGNQKAIIENVLAGKDTFVLMPTGGGKSLCYQLPSILMEGTAIVISPLIALMKNQVDAMRNFSEEDGVAHFINSSLNKSAIDQVNIIRTYQVAVCSTGVLDQGRERGFSASGKDLFLCGGRGALYLGMGT